MQTRDLPFQPISTPASCGDISKRCRLIVWCSTSCEVSKSANDLLLHPVLWYRCRLTVCRPQYLPSKTIVSSAVVAIMLIYRLASSRRQRCQVNQRCRSINESMHRSTNHSISLSTNQSINQSTNKSTNPSSNQSSNQSINIHPINESINHVTNQSINQSVAHSIN